MSCNNESLSRFAVLSPYLPVLVVWLAVSAISAIVCWELGFLRILRKYPFTVLLLAACLGAVPAGGLVKVSHRYRARIASVLFRKTSPDILSSGCPVFPADNIWNRSIAGPGHRRPVALIISTVLGPKPRCTRISGRARAFPTPSPMALSCQPFCSWEAALRKATRECTVSGKRSRRGRRPDDAHVLVLNRREYVLYELFASVHQGPCEWSAGSAAIFDLRSNRLHPEGWTSADAAGLPGKIDCGVRHEWPRRERRQSGKHVYAIPFHMPGNS